MAGKALHLLPCAALRLEGNGGKAEFPAKDEQSLFICLMQPKQSNICEGFRSSRLWLSRKKFF